MKSQIAFGFLVAALFFGGCHEKTLNNVPVNFDAVGLEVTPETSNPYALKITGIIRERGKTLANKTVLLRIAGAVSFRNGVSQPFYARNDSLLLTNGASPLECWIIFSSTNEVRKLAAESSTAHFEFRSDGYAELKPVEINIR